MQAVCATLQIWLCFEIDYLVRNSGLIITVFFALSSEFIQLFLKIKKTIVNLS